MSRRPTSSSEVVPTAEHSLRVATFNVRHGVGAWRRLDVAAMARACASLQADVLALQEVDRHSQRAQLSDQPTLVAAASGLQVHFAPTVELDPVGRYGIALATRWQPVDLEEYVLPASSERRVAIIAEVEVPAREVGHCTRTLTVATTHLHNDEPVALRQLDALLARLETRSGSRHPVLLMGDLNCGPDMVVPRLMGNGFAVADSAPTFPAGQPRRRIDWIAGRNVEFADVTVPDLTVSDHRPLVAWCRLG